MNWMANIDRRVIYAILMIIVFGGLLVPLHLPLIVGPQAQGFYDAVEGAPVDRLSLISTNWSASTQGENRPQTRVIMTHMMRRHIKFAIVSFDVQSTTLTQALAEELAKEHGYVYGKDYINWGFRADITSTIKGCMQNIIATIKEDSVQHKPLETFPIMQGVTNFKELGVICEASPSGTYKSWIQFAAGAAKSGYCFAPTSVMAPETYTYLDSGQMKGMLFGIKGAAEYERLLKQEGFTTRAMTPISFALILLFIFIGLGNIGMFAERRKAVEQARLSEGGN